ncbi:MAG: hypothetical protein M0036_09000 [Desulfobacteraceae bacterium]|nr:hypothetical protein [Desulfobacteraceae bacterium]
MKSSIIIAIIAFISIAISMPAFAGEGNNGQGNAYAYAYGKNKKHDRIRKQIINILKKEKVSLAQIGLADQAELAAAKGQLAAAKAELAEVESKLAECQIAVADAQANALFGAEEAAPVIAATPADPRKFAIARLNDGNYVIYTNNWPYDDETKAKMDAMVAGTFHVEVKVINVETGIEVLIESDTEAFDWDKDGYDWFIGRTIFG